MAETVAASGAKTTDSDIDGVPYSPEKRKASEVGDGEPQEKKKFTMGLTVKKPKTEGEQKISISLGSSKKLLPAATAPIKMSLSTQKAKEPAPVKPRTAKVAQIFNEDESDEEEMPPEAKMRMRNIGRDTPTAAGPNSFGKGKLGFCDRQRILERQLKQEMDEVSGD